MFGDDLHARFRRREVLDFRRVDEVELRGVWAIIVNRLDQPPLHSPVFVPDAPPEPKPLFCLLQGLEMTPSRTPKDALDFVDDLHARFRWREVLDFRRVDEVELKGFECL